MIFPHNKVETECATEDEYSSMITFKVKTVSHLGKVEHVCHQDNQHLHQTATFV